MHASIHSSDEYNEDSKGKTYRVSAPGVTIKTDGGILEISALGYERTGGFAPFDGEPKSFVRAFNLALDPSEVVAILNAALKAGIIKAQFIIAED